MIIGRKEEQQRLLAAHNSEYSEFVAVYGRRRVGKTFLIRETFNYQFTFTHTGLSNTNTRGQLQEFSISLSRRSGKNHSVPSNWIEAFDMLIDYLTKSKDRRKTVFIDEMPWMDAPRSGFVSALEHFWNGWAAARKDILLIVCGSASSWIINKLLKNHGGLYNRVTTRIHLNPFTLAECEEYSIQNKLGLSRKQILEGYMVMGGVPFYWSRLNGDKSMAQNIDELFFSANGEFRHEFDNLYASLFNRPEKYIKIVNALGTKKVGMTREEIVSKTGLDDNGNLTEILQNLTYSGFIRKYSSFAKKTKGALFQLIDNYTLFYYQFIKNYTDSDANYWLKMLSTSAYTTWSGLAFERICLLHTEQLKKSLGISGIIANVYSWRINKSDDKPGAQIDLLIDRADGVINICEIKYSDIQYSITLNYYKTLTNKIARFIEETGTKKSLRLTFITASGLAKNKYSDIVLNELTADDLFV